MHDLKNTKIERVKYHIGQYKITVRLVILRFIRTAAMRAAAIRLCTNSRFFTMLSMFFGKLLSFARKAAPVVGRVLSSL